MKVDHFNIKELRELLVSTKKKLISKEAVVSEQNQIITEKENTITKNKNIITENKDIIKKYKEIIEELETEIKLLKHKLFGESSEKQSTLPEDNTLDEAKTPEEELLKEIEEVDEEITVAEHTRKKRKSGKRNALPKNLPTVDIICDLPEDEKFCECGCQLKHIKDSVSEQLEIIPAQLYKVRYIRRVYASCDSKCDKTIKTAAMPNLPLPKSIAGPGLLAHTITAKYQDHLPLYRQEQILQRLGIGIKRQTINSWVIKAYKLLLPLYDLMLKNINEHDISFADETTLQVIKEKGKKAQTKSYMWVISGGEKNKFSCVFKYSPSRSHDILYELFDGFSGYLHCDGYGGYDSFCKNQTKKDIKIIQVGCWYHARRKFVEAAKTTKSPGIAKWIINKIAKLSKIEADIKDYASEDKYNTRQEDAIPILDEIKSKLDLIVETTPEKSKLGIAVNYTLNQWYKLINYTQDGRLEISNNDMEREIKPFAVGRKNWLFSYSVEGAICSAVYFSFQSTCKHHGINYYLWLKYVFANISGYPEDKLSELLPYNIDPKLLEAAGKVPKFTQQNDPLDTNDPPDTS